MKKIYTEPEFELHRFQFGSMMSDDPDFQGLTPSDPQGQAEGHGGGL
jgi:hypothetical protein